MIRFGVAGAAAAALLGGGGAQARGGGNTPIQHVIFIMQENRSFDNYFGTYPGADGIPAGTCVPIDPAKLRLGCVAPFHDEHDINAGGPHAATDAMADLADGIKTAAMNGYVASQINGGSTLCSIRVHPHGGIARPAPGCQGYTPGIERHDAVGYHTADELPNYWAYARHFLLQDALFEGVRSWSVAAHLDLTSEWSALCGKTTDVATCRTSANPRGPNGNQVVFPWVNLFQLMDLHRVTWKYYLGQGPEPDCEDGEMTCEPQIQANSVFSFWNPPPGYASVQAQGSAYLAAHNPTLDQFLLDVKNGSLPQVSWIVPASTFSEHPDQSVTSGMEYVTAMVNAVMQSPYWQNTAIFISWDDWGGFYDHVVPPNVDTNKSLTPIQGFGLRVPGLLVSAYAKPNTIDHHVLSHDSYATLIEDLFMGGARLDPAALGEPDARPTIRDELTKVTYYDGTTAKIGDLMDEFDFRQKPLAPLVLSTHIPTLPSLTCGSTDIFNPQHCGSSTVAVTWASVAGAHVPGPFTYHVLRDGVALPGCVTTGTSCTDIAPSGVHYYRIYSVDSANLASPACAATEADVP